MIYQRRYELHIIEEENYFSAVIRHCNGLVEYSFEWDKQSQNEYATISETRREFQKFLKKEFHGYGYYIHEINESSVKKIEKFNPVSGGFLIFVPLEWHEFLNNWLEISSSEEISSEEEEELLLLWKEKFPSFDLYSFYGYRAIEAFGEPLDSL